MTTQPKPLMKCGHQANGINASTNEPVCVICIGLIPGASEVAGWMSALLLDRQARCTCGREFPSTMALDDRLPFFEYRGEGSREALEYCGNCGYTRTAHERKEKKNNHICSEFKARGAREYDTYYCGHNGWD